MTFQSLNTWLQEVEQFTPNGGKDIVKLLVGNKVSISPTSSTSLID